MSHKKFGPDRFSRFDVYWIQTDRQTDKPNLYIDKSGFLFKFVHTCYPQKKIKGKLTIKTCLVILWMYLVSRVKFYKVYGNQEKRRL